MPTSPPFSGSKTTIDEILSTENITLGGGEMRVVAQGLGGKAIFTFFISVECSRGDIVGMTVCQSTSLLKRSHQKMILAVEH